MPRFSSPSRAIVPNQSATNTQDRFSPIILLLHQNCGVETCLRLRGRRKRRISFPILVSISSIEQAAILRVNPRARSTLRPSIYISWPTHSHSSPLDSVFLPLPDHASPPIP